MRVELTFGPLLGSACWLGLGFLFIENYAKAYGYTDPRTRIPCD